MGIHTFVVRMSSTGYQFQLVAFRGTLNVNAVFGGLSNQASGTAGSTAPVAAVAVGPASAGVLLGATQQFTATVLDGAGSLLTGQTIAWAASNPAVATVNGTGLVTALASGTTTGTATPGGGTGTGTPPAPVPV